MDWVWTLLLFIATGLAAALVAWLTLSLFADMLRRKESREEIAAWLEEDRFADLYRRHLNRALDRVANALTPKDAASDPPPERGILARYHYDFGTLRAPTAADAVRAGRDPFGWPVFDFALRLAIVYPIVFLFALWAWTGAPGLIGDLQVPPALEGDDERLAARCALVLFVGLLLTHVYNRAKGDAVVALLLAFAFAGAVAFSVAVAVRRGIDGRIVYGSFVLIMLGLLFAAAATGLPTDEMRVWIVFLGVLPLINGVFDYLSFGVTRWLVACGARRGNLWTVAAGLADLFGALILFTALGCTLIMVLTLMNAVAPNGVVDLQGTLNDIGENPGRYWWLYLTFFSTLLPTFAHYSLTLVCLVGLIPKGFRVRVAAWVREDRSKRLFLRNVVAPAALSVFAAFAILAPIAAAALSVQALFAWAPDIGQHYLWLFAVFADWIGAPVSPDEVGAPIRQWWI